MYSLVAQKFEAGERSWKHNQRLTWGWVLEGCCAACPGAAALEVEEPCPSTSIGGVALEVAGPSFPALEQLALNSSYTLNSTLL